MTLKHDDPFFVGYFRKIPPRIRDFALMTGVAIIGFLGAMALLLPSGTVDPGPGGYANDLQGGTLIGMVDTLPYPILRVPAANNTPARAILLGGQDKVGAQGRVAVGSNVIEIGGVFVRRGDIQMLLVAADGAKASAQDLPGFVRAPTEDLGRWQLTGEICDGKCYSGAMKPGSGLAHKACANLCILSGLPPVLVMQLPVEGSTVVLLADQDGGPMPDYLFDLTAVPLRLDGHLERRDDLLIFRIDTNTAQKI